MNNQNLLLQMNWFERVWLSSNISLHYRWNIWDIQGENEKEFFTNELFWVGSLKIVENFFDHLNRHDSDINVIVFDHYTNDVLIYLGNIWTKSLYINDQNLFSPNIGELINSNSKLDFQYLGLIRKFWYNQNDLTPWNNIKRLLPWYLYKGNINTFYKRYEKIKLDNNLAVDFLLPLYLNEAILNRLEKIEDKTIWVLLSGWLDSSLLSALLIRANNNLEKPKKIRFFTTENEWDYMYAKEVAKYLWIKLEVISNQDVELSDTELFGANETPVDLGSVVPNTKLFKAIADKWVYTVFTWDWPDELFRWYRRNEEDFDYHQHDMLNELIYYHFPRLEKTSSYYWIKLITPYINIKLWNMCLQKNVGMFKQDLKNYAKWLIPDDVIYRAKEPLKNADLRKDKKAYQEDLLNRFILFANNIKCL